MQCKVKRKLNYKLLEILILLNNMPNVWLEVLRAMHKENYLSDNWLIIGAKRK